MLAGSTDSGIDRQRSANFCHSYQEFQCPRAVIRQSAASARCGNCLRMVFTKSAAVQLRGAQIKDHVRPSDDRMLAAVLRGRVEYNIEANPFAGARGDYLCQHSRFGEP